MEVVNHITELIGKTPMIKINSFSLPNDVHIYAKLEFYNPGGSIKDRMGVAILEAAEKEGLLKKGSTIIEATAGNTGIGLAIGAISKGYRLICVVPGKFSIEKQKIMKALGVEIISTPTEDGLRGAFKKVEELKTLMPDAFIPDQFNNPNNVIAHYVTGQEIYEQLEGKIDFFVSGAGSGGTFTGIMKYLKGKNPKIHGIQADPEGSIMGGGNCHAYRIEGIGNDFIPSTMDLSVVDEVIKIKDSDAIEMVKKLALQEGLLVGSSSGAAFYAAMKKAQVLKKGTLVVVFADRSDRYLSQDIYNQG